MPQTQPSTSVPGFFYAALAAALWSLITLYSRELFALGTPPLETAFWRSVFGGVCFLVYALLTRALFVSWKDALGMFTAGGLLGALLFGAFQISIERSGGATAVVLLYTAPAWVAVFSRVFFREAITRAKLGAMGMALAGVILVALAGGSNDGGATFSASGIVWGLAAGFGYASFYPLTFHYGRRCSVQAFYTFAILGATLVLLPMVQPLDLEKTSFEWGLLASMGLFTNFMAYIALGLSLRYISQVQSAVVGNIEPVLGTLWVCLFFDENFSAPGWAGCALILLAVFVLTLEKGRRADS